MYVCTDGRKLKANYDTVFASLSVPDKKVNNACAPTQAGQNGATGNGNINMMQSMHIFFNATNRKS